MVFRKSVEDADYFVGLIFKVDARKEGGEGRSRIFVGKKRREGFESIQGIFVKIEFVRSFFFFAVMEVNGKEFVESLRPPPSTNSISNVFSSEERRGGEKKKKALTIES